MAPRLFQQFEQHKLAHTTRVLHRYFGVSDKALHDLFRGGDPPCSGTRSNDFGKRVKTHDAPINVHAKIGWYERRQEVFVGSWRRDRRSILAGIRLHLEEVVRFVFHYVKVMFPRNLIDVSSTLLGLCGTCRVLTSRDGI